MAMVEQSDANFKSLLGFAGGLLGVLIVVHFLVWLLFVFFQAHEASKTAPQYPLAAGQEDRLPPEPRLQTAPREDLQALRAEEDQMLNSYRWVDRNAKIVRIPIRDAMRLTLERGLPTRAGAGGQ